MKTKIVRKTGGHEFSNFGGNAVPRCVTCGADEDDAFVGGQECTYKAKPIKEKNLCGKTRPIDNPYEVWRAGDWIWKVLKKYQINDNKPYARAFCAVYSPITRTQMSSGYELGDCYVSDYKDAVGAVRIA